MSRGKIALFAACAVLGVLIAIEVSRAMDPDVPPFGERARNAMDETRRAAAERETELREEFGVPAKRGQRAP